MNVMIFYVLSAFSVQAHLGEQLASGVPKNVKFVPARRREYEAARWGDDLLRAWDDPSRPTCERCAAYAFEFGGRTQDACNFRNGRCGYTPVKITGCSRCRNPPAKILKDRPRTYTVTNKDVDRLCDLHAAQFKNGASKKPLPAGKYGYVYYDKSRSNPKILITTPHAHQTWRYEDTARNGIHKSEMRVGAMVKLLTEITGMPGLRNNNWSDDPNYYDKIPANTRTAGFRPGNEIPFKYKMRSIVRDNPSIELVLDLHGASLEGSPANWAVDVGTGRGRALSGRKGEQAHQKMTRAFSSSGLHASDNRKFTGMGGQLTVTNFAVKQLRKDAMQIEIESSYRVCYTDRRLDRPARNRMKKVVQSLVDAIFNLQKHYE